MTASAETSSTASTAAMRRKAMERVGLAAVTALLRNCLMAAGHSVAASAHGFNHRLRFRAHGVELFAQIGYMRLNDVGVMLPVVVVEVFEHLALADDFAWVMDEVFEDAVLGGGE